MSSHTPIAKRSPAENTNAVNNSSLGMLAAIASPSSAPKTQPPTHMSTPVVSDTHRQQTKTSSAQTPSTLQPLDAHSNSESVSPLPSPSTSAAMRKGMTISKGLTVSAVAEIERKLEMQGSSGSPEDRSAEASSATAPVSGISPPHATLLSSIPASQLDVLALVTATSPPMPSRRRWAPAPPSHSTAKPAVSHDHSDGSDTVSEDETTLRSHSARIRSRHHAVRLRPLPHNDLAADGPGVLDFKHDQQRLTMSAKPLRSRGPIAREAKPHVVLNRNGIRVRRSSGETTETDDDEQQQQQQPGHAVTPHRQRIVGYPPPNGAASRAIGTAEHSMAPASEPAMHRRARRRQLHENARGVVLSKRLSELTEETEDNNGVGEPSRSRESSLSLSSSPSASPSRQQRMRAKRVRARKRVQQSGSETETDAEMASKLPGSETETDPSFSNGTSTPSAGSGGTNGTSGAAFADPREGTYRRLAGGSSMANRLPPFAGDRAPNKDGAASGAGSRPMLPPIAQLDQYIRPRREHGQKRAGNPRDRDEGNTSGGETTETDEEFFSPSRALHSSIRPPRRVVRHLASLRAQQSHSPAGLQLDTRLRPPHPGRHNHDIGAQARTYSVQSDAPQPTSSGSSNGGYGPHYSIGGLSHTAPVSATDGSGSGGFGLGIASIDSDYAARGSGSSAVQTRVVSTPESVAIPSIASSIRGSPRPAPQGQISNRPNRANSGADPSTQGNGIRRDPFAQGANEFTYHGAALRRLEKSYVRGNALVNGASGPPSSSAAAAAAANRKRALTAPSSYDPPGFVPGRGGQGRHIQGGVGIGGRTTSSSEIFFDDEREAAAWRSRANRSLASSNAGTPPEWNQPLDARIHPLGISPVSSLRSSLISHQQRSFAQPPLSSANSPTSSTNGAQQQVATRKATAAADEGEDLHDRPASPSMDAALRKSRKRQHSSGTMALPFSSGSPPLSQSNKSSHPAHSPSSKRRAHRQDEEDGSPNPNDVVFPPIDPDTPPN